ncbi:hypothetical protein DITRI_Ditri14bG0107600 [Diplodiscus trichospermus]
MKGNESVSLLAAGTLVAAAEGLVRPDLHTNVGLAVVVIGFLADIDDGEKESFPVGFLVALLLLRLRLLVYDLNLKLGFDFDAADVVVVVAVVDDDDSFEDPDSGPCAFPVPAFNGGHLSFLLVGCWFFTLSLLPNFLLLSVLLPPH